MQRSLYLHFKASWWFCRFFRRDCRRGSLQSVCDARSPHLQGIKSIWTYFYMWLEGKLSVERHAVNPRCPPSSSLVSVSLPLWPKLSFPLTTLTRINMLDVVVFARSTICHREEPRKKKRQRKALAPSALLSGDGFVCLQQLNQSLKMNAIIVIHWFMIWALIKQVMEY